MSRETSLDCLLEAFEHLLAAREAGDDQAKAQAAAEFRKWLRQEMTACAVETDPLLRELAVALLAVRKYVPATELVHHSLYDSDSLPNPAYAKMQAGLAKAEERGLLPPGSI